MKRLAVLFFVVLGLFFGFQDVRAQNTQNADLHPPYLAEEEPAVSEGAEAPVLEEGEEGEVIERGLRRFKYKGKKSRPRIRIPKKPKRQLRFPPSKRLPEDGGGQEGKEPSTEMPPTPIPPRTGWVPFPQDTPPPPQVPPTPELPGIPGVPPPDTPSPPQCVWHTSDIIDPRIDVSAQQRLMAMMSRGGDARRDASAMISSVKQGDLAGILLSPRKAVSDRGQRMTPQRGWWELIPKGQLGTCLREPVGEPPMLLYRDKNGEAMLDPSVIDHTLRTTWGQCGLPMTIPACSYLVDLHKPPPQPGAPEEEDKSEGFSLLTVHVTGAGYPLRRAMVSVSGTYENEVDSEKRQSIWGTTAPTAAGRAKLVVPNSLQKVTVIVQGRYAVAAPGVVGFSDASFLIEGSILDQILSVDLDPL